MSAPIGLIVYNRPEHTRQTVEALLQNDLSNESELHIFSDAARNEKSKQGVEEVREYLKTISGFKKITTHYAENNLGCKTSVIGAIMELSSKYDRFIIVEDDIVTAKTFLSYINEALDFYECDERIFSVTGHGLPLRIPKDYTHDIYLSPRSMIWGWGTWSDRVKNIDWEVSDYAAFCRNRSLQKEFEQGGEDLTKILHRQMKGEIDTWDIQMAYHQFKTQQYCICPVKSQVTNIGIDGSGVHFKSAQNKYRVAKEETTFSFIENIQPDKRIINAQRLFFKKPLYQKIGRYLINLFK